MNLRRSLGTLLAALFVFGASSLAAPSDANAFVRLGADGIWVPLAGSQVTQQGAELDSSHELSSFGASAHANLGFDAFSAGLKLNYFSEGMEFEADGEKVRRNELDINAMARFGIPKTKLGLFAEGGASMSTQFDGVGYNVGLGAEYTLVSAAILDFNAGLSGQYVNLPAEINGISTDNKTFRGMVFLGVDFGL
jgi:hypothetical protein